MLALLKRGLIKTGSALTGLIVYPTVSLIFNIAFRFVASWTIARLVFSPIKSLFSLFFPQQMQQANESISKLIFRFSLGLIQATIYYFAVLPLLTLVSIVDFFLIKPIQGLYDGFTQGFQALFVFDAKRYSILFNLYSKFSERYASFEQLNDRFSTWLYEKISNLFQAAPQEAGQAAPQVAAQAVRGHINFARQFDELEQKLLRIPLFGELSAEQILEASTKEELTEELQRYTELKNKLNKANHLANLDIEEQPQDDLFDNEPLNNPIVLYKERFENDYWTVVPHSTLITNKERLLNHLALSPRLPNGEHLFENDDQTRFKWHNIRQTCDELEQISSKIQNTLIIARHVVLEPLNITRFQLTRNQLLMQQPLMNDRNLRHYFFTEQVSPQSARLEDEPRIALIEDDAQIETALHNNTL